MKLEVGQKLWLVENNHSRTQREVTVEKVGRKWAQVGPHRLSIQQIQDMIDTIRGPDATD